MAWGIIRQLIRDHSYDHEFVANHSLGFEELAAHCQSFTADFVAGQTGLSKQVVRQVGAMFAAARPRVANYPGISLEHQTNGVNTIRVIAALGGLLRWSVTAATTDLAALAAVQVLHAATFAAAHLASVHMIAARVPGGLAATGQSLYAALSGGLVMGAMMLAVGPLYEALGLKSFFVMAGICGLALLLLAVAPKTATD